MVTSEKRYHPNCQRMKVKHVREWLINLVVHALSNIFSIPVMDLLLFEVLVRKALSLHPDKHKLFVNRTLPTSPTGPL